MDEEHFVTLYRELRPSLVRFARRVTDVETANDLAIDALRVIWAKNLPNPRNARARGQVASLAFGVLRGLIANAHRAERRQQRLAFAIGNRLATTETGAADPERELISELEVHAALAALPRPEREVVELIRDGYRSREIALILGCSPGAVSMRLRRARDDLRAFLESQEGGA